ncbi:MAG: flagellar protein FliS [Lachnospiraceae bacterium]|nr:flagellar protein FliS [Lachnospiraceae bacterium]
MTGEEKKEYTARVAQANRTELVVIIYELLLDSVHEGERAYESGDRTGGEKHIRKAQAYLQELMGSLDLKYEISLQLRRLYRYVNEQLIASIIRQEPVQLDSVCEVIEGLMESFAEVAKQDTSGPVMDNGQQIYAGLTYGKGTLNEVSLDGNSSGYGGIKV